ncbi:MAG: four-carbon acid sugar kinase family protein [Marinobacter sp.]|nr:four-carbon acid sugar kinase family protein [Marinobacter sp.]
MAVLLGCIADDLTGATDLASFLREAGMQPLLLSGIPDEIPETNDADALIIALKSRTAAPAVAVEQCLEALEWLQAQHCEKYYFKYGSTFDSTEHGNIGPVIDALLDRLQESMTVACPALPVNGRTQYLGHLFVNGQLLNESGMEQHPLNPMIDACLVRVLDRQTSGRVGLVDHRSVEQGPHAITEALIRLHAQGVNYALVDALRQQDLQAIGQACADLRLVTGGSGLAGALAEYFRAQGLLGGQRPSLTSQPVPGEGVILSGSCSRRTREQVGVYKELHPAFKVDPEQIASGELTVGKVIDWFQSQRQGSAMPMIYASDDPDQVARNQRRLGSERAGELVESMLGQVATSLSALGVRKFIVAGGETSGAVIAAMGIRALRIEDSIAPGVPATRTPGSESHILVLKSGNFGDRDFFRQAAGRLQ